MKPNKYQTKKFAAYDAANAELNYFDTKEDVEKWLTENDYEGASEEAEAGDNWIAEIKWRSVFIVSDRKEDYHEHTDACPEDCDKEEWPYDSDFDYVGNTTYEEVEYDLSK
jgi:hypothetical protein